MTDLEIQLTKSFIQNFTMLCEIKNMVQEMAPKQLKPVSSEMHKALNDTEVANALIAFNIPSIKAVDELDTAPEIYVTWKMWQSWTEEERQNLVKKSYETAARYLEKGWLPNWDKVKIVTR